MTLKNSVRALTLVLVLALAATLGGCGKIREPYKDAPVTNVLNDKPADKITMPDGFSNLTTKCDHGNRIYVAFHGDNAYASIAVVPQDPSCR
jgi:hypothetical protein